MPKWVVERPELREQVVKIEWNSWKKKWQEKAFTKSQNGTLVLEFLEDTDRFFLFSSLPAVSSSCPGILLVKIEVHTGIFSLIKPAF